MAEAGVDVAAPLDQNQETQNENQIESQTEKRKRDETTDGAQSLQPTPKKGRTEEEEDDQSYEENFSHSNQRAPQSGWDQQPAQVSSGWDDTAADQDQNQSEGWADPSDDWGSEDNNNVSGEFQDELIICKECDAEFT